MGKRKTQFAKHGWLL